MKIQLSKPLRSFRYSFTFVSLIALGLFATAAAVAAQTTTATTTAATTSATSASGATSTTATTTGATNEATTTPPRVPDMPAGPTRELTTQEQTRIINLAANISNQLDAVGMRLSDIATRLERRISKTDSNRFNTPAAEAALIEARSALRLASAILHDIDQAVFDATTAANPAAAWLSVKTKYQSARTELLEAKTALQAATVHLAMPRPAAPATSTTTASTTPTI